MTYYMFLQYRTHAWNSFATINYNLTLVLITDEQVQNI